VDYFDNPRLIGDVQVIHFTMEDNPNLTKKYKASMRATFSGTFYRRYILGEWVNAEGAIYRDVWPKVEIYTTLPTTDINGKLLPQGPEWLSNAGGYQQRTISIDFGMENPSVFLDWFDTGKRIYLDREWFWDSRKKMRQLTVAEQADALEEFAGTERRGLKIVLDPSASAMELELVNRGFWVVPADNDVLPGIQRVSSILNLGIVSVNASCENFIREMQSYAWDEKKAERGEEAPLKKDDHSVDSARYFAMESVPEWRLQALGMSA
jgi:PBSX family phage terminase large subunit